jgi:hypothetical protein
MNLKEEKKRETDTVASVKQSIVKIHLETPYMIFQDVFLELAKVHVKHHATRQTLEMETAIEVANRELSLVKFVKDGIANHLTGTQQQ